jgi:DNA-binding PadR family transcriptional regulator
LLAKSFNTKISSFKSRIQRLKYIGYIADKEDTGIEKIYYLTDLGIEKINYLRSKIPKIFGNLN